MSLALPDPTQKPWEGERVVTLEEARGLIADQFPELNPLTIGAFGSGWDNTAFLANGNVLFRFPRRRVAVPAMEIEIRMLPALQSLPLPVPHPTFVGRPTEAYPWPWAGYRLLPGDPLFRADLDEAARERLAEPLGRFLSALHDVPVPADFPGDVWGRFDLAKRRAQITAYLDKLFRLGLVVRLGIFDAVMTAVDAWPLPETRVLAHGDLDARHWLVSEGELAGVIDWGDLHRGAPAVDLLAPWMILPPSARSRFWSAYGRNSDALRAWSRFRALNQTVVTAAYGVEIDDTPLIRETLGALERLRID